MSDSNLKKNESRYDPKEHMLVNAATSGQLDVIKDLVSSGASVDSEDYNKTLFYASKNYLTPLQLAADNGHIDCLNFLIEHGADVNAKDRFDVTALHMASEKGHLLCVKSLLNAYADCSPATKCSKSGCYTAVPYVGGTTPLHIAAANRHVQIIKKLIHYGADYNAVDEKGRTSLYISAFHGFEDCVMAHLENAVGRDILSLPCWDTSDTPLHFAVSNGMVDCVRALIHSGSDVNHRNYAGFSPLHLAVSPSLAHREKSLEILRILVLEGYNTNINQVDGTDYLSPLHYVCFQSFQSHKSMLWRSNDFSIKIAKFLISYGADINISTTRGFKLIEWELTSSRNKYDVLKYILRSILHPPRLSSLNISSQLMPQNTPQEQNTLIQSVMRHRGFVGFVDTSDPVELAIVSKKLVWYENIATNPRTLKHYCRFSIRHQLGTKSMRDIHKLPLPESIKSYLLLNELED